MKQTKHKPTYHKGMYQYFKKPLSERLLLSLKEGRFWTGFRYYSDDHISYYFILAQKTLSPTFKLGGKTYKYYISQKNSVLNERVAELPILEEFYKKYGKNASFLEVGNVLNVHSDIAPNHIVVDKYEEGEKILNVDIVDYKPNKKFDMIVSISTLEHVGYDESPQDPKKVNRAMERILSLLKPNGKLLITMPLGYNPAVDEYVKKTKLKKQFMVKSSIFNDWVETDEKTALSRPINSKYKGDNSMVILTK